MSDNPMETKTERLVVVVTPAMKEDLELAAYQASQPADRVTVSTIVRRAVLAYLPTVGIDPKPPWISESPKP